MSEPFDKVDKVNSRTYKQGKSKENAQHADASIKLDNCSATLSPDGVPIIGTELQCFNYTLLVFIIRH